MTRPDALVLLSFGGPEAPQDVLPFLRNVTAGRGVPPHRLQEVAQHYLRRGGVSPINAANRVLVAALQDELAARATPLPVLWGNRNWHPFLAETFTRALQEDLTRLTVVTTSAYPSASGCRQYRQDIDRALARADPQRRLTVTKVGPYYGHPGVVRAWRRSLDRALTRAAALAGTGRVHLLFVTHSIPLPMQLASRRRRRRGYREAHEWLIGQILPPEPAPTWDLVYCSRSGRPGQPWLEPDVTDRIRDLATGPDRPGAVVLVPIGFVSDHMEVIQDLDTEAVATATEHGLACVRADTIGTSPDYVRALVDLALQPSDPCPADCCEVALP